MHPIKSSAGHSMLINLLAWVVLLAWSAVATDDSGWIESETLDADTDGMVDTWEIEHFGNTGASSAQPAQDPDNDGSPNIEEYIAGTSPTNPASCLLVGIAMRDGRIVVEFNTIRAGTTHYGSLTRFYRLEECTNLASGSWTAVTGMDSIAGSDQDVQHTAGLLNTHRFYRIVVRLQ